MPQSNSSNAVAVEMTAQKHSTLEDSVLRQMAPELKQLGERRWGTEASADVSYPLEAHAEIAKIEDSSFWFRHRNAVIQTVVENHPPSGTIIDIGGGNGAVALALKQRGFSTILMEPGSVAARIAHDRGLTVIQNAFTADLFARGSVPAIGLFDVIEHIADDLHFLNECRTALCPGGLVYVTVPALHWLWSKHDQYAGHHRRYSRRLLRQRLVAAGFEQLLLSAFFSLLVPPLALLRTLPSVLGQRRLQGPDDALQHHRTNQMVSTMIERALGFEKALLARRMTVPFGTSLVAVARKPMNDVQPLAAPAS